MLAVRILFWPALAIALFGVARMVSVQAQQTNQGQIVMGRQNPFPDFEDMDPILRERQLRALNVARQKELVNDTRKLVQLATDLNAEITAKQPASLSPEELSKVARIEKLARSVREKMTLSIGGGPAVADPFSHPIR